MCMFNLEPQPTDATKIAFKVQHEYERNVKSLVNSLYLVSTVITQDIHCHVNLRRNRNQHLCLTSDKCSGILLAANNVCSVV